VSDESRRPRPSLGAVFANFRTYDAPFFTKLRLAARNKARTRQNCRGNDG
jgi:hypothetical protein